MCLYCSAEAHRARVAIWTVQSLMAMFPDMERVFDEANARFNISPEEVRYILERYL